MSIITLGTDILWPLFLHSSSSRFLLRCLLVLHDGRSLEDEMVASLAKIKTYWYPALNKNEEQ